LVHGLRLARGGEAHVAEALDRRSCVLLLPQIQG
jgi:hypothetical protein